MTDYQNVPLSLLGPIKARMEAETRNLDLQSEELEMQLRDMGASNDEHHNLPFFFPVQGTTAVLGMQTLGMWARRSPDALAAGPFTIEIGSPGGEVMPGLALIDYIRALRAKGYIINTHGFGEIASMAAVLLQAGSTRSISENSYILLHEPSTMSQGTSTKMRDESRWIDRIENRLASLLAERSSLSVEEIKRGWHRRDWWLDAEEALHYGFVDEVLASPSDLPDSSQAQERPAPEEVGGLPPVPSPSLDGSLAPPDEIADLMKRLGIRHEGSD